MQICRIRIGNLNWKNISSRVNRTGPKKSEAWQTAIGLHRIVISDDDIVHLHNTVARLLEIIKAFQLASALVKGEEEIEKVKKQVESYEQIKALISVDTLKTMQLLGFNYKAAIGEPLTQICADAISNMCSKNKTNTPTQKKR